MRQTLIQKRKEHNMTQEEVAIFLDVTPRHYRALEAGTSDGSVKVWRQLAELFGTKIDCLLSQENSRSDYTNSDRAGIDDAKELNEAAKEFDVDVETILDVARDGRLDDPARRGRAQRLKTVLDAVL